MSFLRQINGTDLTVSAIGLGTVKFGRNEGVKYPQSFSIPNDKELSKLLDKTKELGINFIDTAPAYGNSEERIGKLLKDRNDWVISTKVGEQFINGQSHFDFSKKQVQSSIESSLRNLNTDYLDIVLIHSDGNDESILSDSDTLETLKKLQDKGLIRAIGMSTKTIPGGILAVKLMDIVMLTYNLNQQDQAVVDYALMLNKGVLVKKSLMSGHIQAQGRNLIQESMQLIFSQPAINSMIVGTINTDHLTKNIELTKEIIAKTDSSL